jgi:hypothetical protein
MSSRKHTPVEPAPRRPRWTLDEDTKLVDLVTRYSADGKPQWRVLYDLPEAHAAFAHHILPGTTHCNTKHLYKRLLKIATHGGAHHPLSARARIILGCPAKPPAKTRVKPVLPAAAPSEPSIPELLAELRRLATESAEVLRRLQQTS